MANSINLLIGRLGADPQMSYTPGKVAVCRLSIAENRRSLNDDKEWDTVTVWHEISAWGPLAERTSALLRKGSLCTFHYRIDYRKRSLVNPNNGKTFERKVPTLTLESFDALADWGQPKGSTQADRQEACMV